MDKHLIALAEMVPYSGIRWYIVVFEANMFCRQTLMAGLDKRMIPMPVTENTDLAVTRWIFGRQTVSRLHTPLTLAQSVDRPAARVQTAAWETDMHRFVTPMDVISTLIAWVIHPSTERV